MSDIFNAANQKIATMGEDNKVRNIQGQVIGSVLNNGEVWNINRKIGHVDGFGRVFEAGAPAGSVHNDGTVYDYDNYPVGKVKDGHIHEGGAALLLLVR